MEVATESLPGNAVTGGGVTLDGVGGDTVGVARRPPPWGLRRGHTRAAETQAAAARTTASTPPARRLRPGDKGLAASSAGGGQDPLWGPFPSPQLKTGGSVPLVQEEARMRKKKRRSNRKG